MNDQEAGPGRPRIPLQGIPVPVWATGLVVLLTVPALVPFLRAGYWQSHDGLIHLYRLISLEDAVVWGQWYPRLFPDFAFNYGFAVLHYYAPLTYYFALVLIGLGADAVEAMKATYALSLPLSALAMWWLARTVWRSDGAGILAAGVYTYVPYHLADVHLRGALAESWAFVWWPLLLWALWCRRFRLLALLLAGLVLTHNLSAILIAPVLALWLLAVPWMHDGTGRWKALGRLVGAGAVGAALSAFYWLSVALEAHWVHLATDVGGRGFLRHLYPLTEWIAPDLLYAYFPDQGVAGEHPLAWMQIAIIVAALVLALLRWRRLHALRARRVAVVLLVVIVVSLSLLTTSSLPVWDVLVFPLGMIQYPWRWLGIVALATGTLSGVLALRPSGVPARPVRWGGALAVTLLLAATTMPGLPWGPVAVMPDEAPESMWAMDFANQQIGATWTAEYLPRWVREERWVVPRAVERPSESAPTALETVRLLRATPWSYTFQVKARAPAVLRLHQFYLPAWQATVDGHPVPTRPYGSLGLVQVQVPAGEHEVKLVWSSTPAVKAGVAISGIGLLLLLVSILRSISLRGTAFDRIRAWPLLIGTFCLAVVVVGCGRLAARPAPPPLTPLDKNVGEFASLVGWRTDAKPPPLRAGQTARVTLYWLARRATSNNYNVFLHLTRADGIPLAQSDGPPVGGYTPTSRWLAGELIPDPRRLRLPATLSPGSYQVWAGLYDPVTGDRLPVAGRDDGRILVGTLSVVR